jgi:NAD(P)-dependent dehydrogenase (short-subunit alcohol dehydrogenase family)
MAADLRGTGVTVNLLLPGGATATGMLPPGAAPGGLRVLDPIVMGPPIPTQEPRTCRRTVSRPSTPKTVTKARTG